MSASSSLKRRPFAPPRPPFESAVDARANEPNGVPPLLSELAVKSSRNTPSSSRVRALLPKTCQNLLYDDVTSTCDYHVTLRYIGPEIFRGLAICVRSQLREEKGSNGGVFGGRRRWQSLAEGLVS